MSCNCCCKNILRLCKVGVCNDAVINLGITAQVVGVHRLVLYFLDTEFTIRKNFAVDEQVTFPTADLNENYVYTARVYEPDGKQVIIRKDAVDYDCIEFETVMSYAVNEISEEASS